MATRVADSHIDAVRLYRRGATIQREVALELSPDMLPLQLEVPGLPLSLSDATVRLRVVDPDPDEALVVGDVHVGLHARPRNEFIDVPALETLRELDRQIEWIEAQLETLLAERGVLGCMEVPARPDGAEGEPPPPSPLGARLALERFVDDAIERRTQRADELRRELEDVTEERDKLRERLERIDAIQRVAASEVTKTVSATLRGRLAEMRRLTLVLEYFVDGARWAPAYQCRIASAGDRAELQMRALICQRTGEDWSGVRLELSTASAVQFTELPRLRSLRIGRAQRDTAQPPGFRPPPRGAAALFRDFDQGMSRARAQVDDRQGVAHDPITAHRARQLAEQVGTWRRSDATDRVELFVPVAGAVMNAPGAAGSAGFGGLVDREREMAEAEEMLDDAYAGAADEGYGAEGKAMPPPPPPAPRMAAAPAPGGPASASSLRARKRAAIGRGGGGAGDASVVRAEVPSFSQLRLPGPEATARRGRLEPVDRRAAYEQSLSRSGLSLDGFDAESAVAEAQHRAAQASTMPLPPGAFDVAAQSGVFDYAYRADARVDVPSDGMFHSVPVSQREGDCRVEYVVVPRLDTNVFRVATITNPLPAPLLSGVAELYVGGEYILSTQLPTVSPREHFRLGLGVEQAIKCARNTRFREARSGSAVVATAELWHTLEIELHNTLSRPASIEVRERIPHPEAGAEVVVEEGEVEPPWEVWTQEPQGTVLAAGRRWQVELEPGASRTLRGEYVIKIYAQNEIVGGNRREA